MTDSPKPPHAVSYGRTPMQMRRVWILAFALWTIPAVAFSVLLALAPEHPGSGSLFRLFLRQGLPWYYWALLTPLILTLTGSLPLDRPPRTRALVLHFVLGIACAYFFEILWFSILMLIPAEDGSSIITLRTLLSSMIFFIPFGLGVYATLASIGYAMDFYRRFRERELVAAALQTQLKEAQLGALRMQLQPHFLFNTLNTIAMLVREGETRTSVRMLARLSDLLRHMLEDEGDQEVPIREELEFLSRYLEIEQIRFQDRLHVDIEVDEGTRDAFIPNLVLQPIVENAIRHGIARRAAAGQIRLTVTRENGTLLLTVCDDGPGLAPDFSMDTLTGIGLRNTVARLGYLYGDAAAMEIGNAGVVGTCVRLRIPYHDTPIDEFHG
jgi:signal transduction histidine kinase